MYIIEKLSTHMQQILHISLSPSRANYMWVACVSTLKKMTQISRFVWVIRKIRTLSMEYSSTAYIKKGLLERENEISSTGTTSSNELQGLVYTTGYQDSSHNNCRHTTHDDVIKWKYFRVTGPLCGLFTGHRWIPRTKASDAELWCLFFICALNKRLSKQS